jgi:hypothetical protein
MSLLIALRYWFGGGRDQFAIAAKRFEITRAADIVKHASRQRAAFQ